MSIVKNIGLFSLDKIVQPGGAEAIIASYTNPHPEKIVETVNFYRRTLASEGEFEPLPVYSDTSDFVARINSLYRTYSDMSAYIAVKVTQSDVLSYVNALYPDDKDVLALINGYVKYSSGADLGARIAPRLVEQAVDLYANIRTVAAGTKDLRGVLLTQYATSKNLGALVTTAFADSGNIGARISGWEVFSIGLDLYGLLSSWSAGGSNLNANIRQYASVYIDLYANIRTYYVGNENNLGGLITTQFAEYLDLLSWVVPVHVEKSKDLYAHLFSIVSSTKNISALAIPTYVENVDLYANITPYGRAEAFDIRVLINGYYKYSVYKDLLAKALVSYFPFTSDYSDLVGKIIPGLGVYTYDILSVINGFVEYSGQGDIGGRIRVRFLPVINSSSVLYSLVSGVGAGIISINTNITGTSSGASSDILAGLRALYSDHTYPLTYEETIVGTRNGLSIIKRALTKLPDITASIHGWQELNMLATIMGYSRETVGDLGARILITEHLTKDILGSITAEYIYDLPTYILSIPPSDIVAYLQSVSPSDIPTYILSIPPKDIRATSGGHLPGDLLASMAINFPVDISSYIIAGYSSTSDILTDITRIGYFVHFGAVVHTAFSSFSKIYASITPRVPKDIRAYISGWQSLDITADVVGVYSRDIGAYVRCFYVENVKDFKSFVRPSWTSTNDLRAETYGWHSAHTTDKPINYHKFPAFMPKILIGHRRGFTILEIEKIWGVFPDLHASITGTPFSKSYLYAFIRGVVPLYANMQGYINAVTPVIYINKLVVNFVNMYDLYAYISAFSGYRSMSASIRGVCSTSTGTSSGSGWVYSSFYVKFYVGTNNGLIIPQSTSRTIRPAYYINRSLLPDLHGYLYGWSVSDLAASVSVQPYLNISGTLTAIDLSHVYHLGASIVSTYVVDFSGSIVGVGGFVGLGASLSVSGQVGELSASISPYLKVLGYRILPVETMPFIDMYAVINPLSTYCGGSSYYDDICAFVRSTNIFVGGSGMEASINSLRSTGDLSTSISGKKFSRIRTINIWYRAGNRASADILCFIRGIASVSSDFGASIIGDYLSTDMGASITGYRYLFDRVFDRLPDIEVYKLSDGVGYLYKKLALTFSSRVEKYIYDGINNALYPMDDGKWVLNLRELSEIDEFYDRLSTDRSLNIDSILEFNTVDEAIRAAISLLVDMSQSDVSASISATGYIDGIMATIYGTSADRTKDLPTKLFIVENMPDLQAYISAFSGFRELSTFINGYETLNKDLYATTHGFVCESLNANIVGVI